jgi:1-acyl-sn-glycerol-3-phosphate acyltransferase
VELVGRMAVGVSAWLGSYELSGGELLPFAGPAIVAVNHTSIADTAPVLASLYRAGLRPNRRCGQPGCGRTHGHIRFLATEILFRLPLLGRLVRHADFLPVGKARSARAALQAGVDALRHGEIIGIYPEGNIAVDLASDGFAADVPDRRRAAGSGVRRTVHETVLLAHERVTAVWRTLSA